MTHHGPIIVIDDDKDDQELLQDVIDDLEINNKLVFFERGAEAFDFLKTNTEQPLVILSDINLPQQSGVEFKRHIDNDPQLRKKSIPFIFFSTHIDKKIVDIAYRELTIQGFFQKSGNYEELKNTVKQIIEYWKICKHPNSV
jgi:CheY-like chemotaxis protein